MHCRGLEVAGKEFLIILNAGRGCSWRGLATAHPLSVSENKLQPPHSRLIISVSWATPLSSQTGLGEPGHGWLSPGLVRIKSHLGPPGSPGGLGKLLQPPRRPLSSSLASSQSLPSSLWVPGKFPTPTEVMGLQTARLWQQSPWRGCTCLGTPTGLA